MILRKFLTAALVAVVVGIGAGRLWADGPTPVAGNYPAPTASPVNGIFGMPMPMPSPTDTYPTSTSLLIAPDDSAIPDMSYDCDGLANCGDGADAIYGALVPAPPGVFLAAPNPLRNMTVRVQLVKPTNLPAGNNFKLAGVTVTAVAWTINAASQKVSSQNLSATADANGVAVMTFDTPKLMGVYVVTNVAGQDNRFRVPPGPFDVGGVSGKAVSKRPTGRSDHTFTPTIKLKLVP